ncbi:MAG: sulfatase [Planctomycetota bacterium]
MSSPRRPNILFIMSDDHASHAMSCYGSVINKTPHLDRIAAGGMRFDNCFCTNSICSPSRASILTGTYNHVNGVTTLHTHWDNTQTSVAGLLRDAGYQTAIVGKWHLGQGPEHWPTGFDYWNILPGQGKYHDPDMVEMGEDRRYEGYVSDIITDRSLEWLENRDPDKPFMLMLHHKAPHRHWQPAERYMNLFADEDVPIPDTFWDDHSGHATAAKDADMRVADMPKIDYKIDPPEGLEGEELAKWKYQRYIKDYLRCVASIDDSTGRVLDWLDANGLTEDTIICYTSDQGFFLGDHGWFDKRFMYEESLRMPFIIRYPREIAPGSACDEFALNVDMPVTMLDYAGVEISAFMQGRSFRPLLQGTTPPDWQKTMYYRYWMHGEGSHNTTAHYGVRTHRYKLIYYYGDGLGLAGTNPPKRAPEWELFDLQNDPCEMTSVYDDPAYAEVIAELKVELARLQKDLGDKPYTG